MSRCEFSKGVRAKAAERSKGLCETCGVRLPVGGYHFDHDVPDGLGGEPTLENCRVLCLPCHKAKTIKHDNPRMQKADRQRKSITLGIRKASQIQSRGFAPSQPQRRASSDLIKQLPPRRWE
jgi:5-methylcytosine-specific restriction endonuclease McrA